jgi:aryl-alcohol dehydrogenase-like predicted oxidoreductase
VQTRSIGSLEVSVVGLGCNNFGRRLDQRQTTSVIDACFDAGVTFFDTADTYGETMSEVFVGEALKGRRDTAVVATKFGMPIDDERQGAAPAYVVRACDDSLRRLQTDWIDLYQLHAPDPKTPIADTLGALFELQDRGKVREIGCSNFSADQLRAAAAASTPRTGFVSVQNQYSLLWRAPESDGVLDACSELGLVLLPYYPLANGLLTGKVRPGSPPPAGSRLATMPAERSAHWLSESLTDKVGELLDVADADDTDLLAIAFSWLLDHDAVASVIAGATSPDQVRANATAPVALDGRLRAELDRITAQEG